MPRRLQLELQFEDLAVVAAASVSLQHQQQADLVAVAVQDYLPFPCIDGVLLLFPLGFISKIKSKF